MYCVQQARESLSSPNLTPVRGSEAASAPSAEPPPYQGEDSSEDDDGDGDESEPDYERILKVVKVTTGTPTQGSSTQVSWKRHELYDSGICLTRIPSDIRPPVIISALCSWTQGITAGKRSLTPRSQSDILITRTLRSVNPLFCVS